MPSRKRTVPSRIKELAAIDQKFKAKFKTEIAIPEGVRCS
jgi:hypothetical protein